MAEKITKRQYFEALINWVDGKGLIFTDGEDEVEVDVEIFKDFAQHEIELLDAKAAKARETAAKKKKEDQILDLVKVALTEEFKTIAEITEELTAAGYDVTVSKVTYRLGVLVKEGVAEKADVKVEGGEGTKTRTVKAYKLAE